MNIKQHCKIGTFAASDKLYTTDLSPGETVKILFYY